jgi:hypothetical protein
MTQRSGLSVALVGLVMAVLCLATLFLIRDWDGPEVTPANELLVYGLGTGFVLFLDLGAVFGLILIVVGLVFALKKQSVKPS